MIGFNVPPYIGTEMKYIEEGDLVLTHKGRYKKVKAKWSNGIKETIKIAGLHPEIHL